MEHQRKCWILLCSIKSSTYISYSAPQKRILQIANNFHRAEVWETMARYTNTISICKQNLERSTKVVQNREPSNRLRPYEQYIYPIKNLFL